jgi:hypothetical protein
MTPFPPGISSAASLPWLPHPCHVGTKAYESPGTLSIWVLRGRSRRAWQRCLALHCISGSRYSTPRGIRSFDEWKTSAKPPREWWVGLGGNESHLAG